MQVESKSSVPLYKKKDLLGNVYFKPVDKLRRACTIILIIMGMVCRGVQNGICVSVRGDHKLGQHATNLTSN